MPCEDAPCCGCCGTNLYGVKQDGDESPPYCDVCGWTHFGDCPMEIEDEEEEATEELAVDPEVSDYPDSRIVRFDPKCGRWHGGPRCGTFSEEVLDEEAPV